MKLKFHSLNLSISQIPSTSQIPTWVLDSQFWSVTKSKTETSFVTETEVVPAGTKTQAGWTLLEVVGPLDFGLVGVLSGLLAKFAKENVPVFCISTYDSDYVLFDQKHRDVVSILLSTDADYVVV